VTGTDIPANSTFRARGAVAGAYSSGVNWLLERSLGPLLLAAQPMSRTNDADSPASFSVAAVGSPPLVYQWFKDGQPLQDGGLISGTRTSTLIFSNVFAGDRGNYSVVVTNDSGSVTSRLASLSVVDPLFTLQPVSQFTNFGKAVTFRVLAVGSAPLSYQWWRNDLKLENGSNTVGSANSTLGIRSVSGVDRGVYWAIVTNAYGCATSSVATLGVMDPVITAQPISQLASPGQTAVFGAMVRGTEPLSYQWRKNGSPLSGQTASTLTLTNVQWQDAGTYDLLVGNAFGMTNSRSVSLAFPAAVDFFNPGVNSNVVYGLALQPDGCIIVAGSFTTVGAQARTNLARLRPDGSLDPLFNPGIAGANSVIYALALLNDGSLLVGGRFTSIDGQLRTNLARLNPDGSLDNSFDPHMSGSLVNALAVQSDGSVVVGGAFSLVAGQPRANLCRLDSDGALDATFNPGASSMVNCLAIQDDGSILVGGGFTSLAGQPRYSLGRLASDGTLDDSFNPGVSGGVFTLAVQADGGVLVGGVFTQLGGRDKANLGRLKPDGSLDTNFTATANGGVFSLAVQANGKILVGGVFTQLRGQSRSYLGRFDANGLLDTTFDTGADGSVYSLALQPNGEILVGGDFGTLGGQPRSRLGRLSNSEPAIDVVTVDPQTGISWFRNGATPEIRQVSFDFSTNLTSWVPLGVGSRISGGWQLSGVVIPPGGTLLGRGLVAAGYQGASCWSRETSLGPVAFTRQPASRTNAAGTIAGFSVQAVGALPLSYQWCKDGTPLTESDTTTGANSSSLLLSNVFGADAASYTVIVSNSYTVVTSSVATLVVTDPVVLTQPANQVVTNGQTADFRVLAVGSGNLTYQWRKNGVDIDGATNSSLTLTNVQWSDGGNYEVEVSGSYGCVISALATLAFQSGADSLHPSSSGSFYALAIQPDGAILVGGSFSSLGSSSRLNIGRLGADGSIDAAFKPGANNTVHCLAVQTDGRILVGGQFTTLGGAARSYFGRLNFDGTVDATFCPAVSSNVCAIALQPDGKVILGGAFTNLCGEPRRFLGRLSVDGTLDTAFNPTASDIVYSLALQPDGRIVAGGAFTNLGGLSRRFIGRFYTDGTIDATFNPGANSNILSLALQPDGKILVAGRFTALAERNCPYVGRLNADGTPDTAFYGAANGVVYCLCQQADGRILTGGNFTSLGGQSRFNLGRLNGDGSLDSTFNPTAGNAVYALALQEDGRILVGGTFVSLAGQTRNGLGRLTNSYPSAQSLAWNGTNITWLRAGAGPEFWSVRFDISTNGTDWQDFGQTTWCSWGWRSTGMHRPSNATVRARGFLTGGYQGGSSWLDENSLGSPAISVQPQTRKNNAATPASFYVLAAGDSPLAYQWFKNGVSLDEGSNTLGVHSNLLQLSSVFAPQAGDYSVVVSNVWGCSTSQIATLTVIDPCITTQPINRTNNAGTVATFTVKAAGSALLGYQWLMGGAVLEDGGNLSGTRSATLRLTNVLGGDCGGYSAIISNSYGCVTSAVASLSVADPYVSVQPTNQYLNVGQTATFSAAGVGSSPISYHWRKDGVNLSGATADSLTLSNVQRQDIGVYDVVLTTPFGSAVSTGATLVVNLATADSWNPGTDGLVRSLAVQTDGKILVGGGFNMLGGQPCTNLGRLLPDGTADTAFNPSINGQVYALALHTNNQILVGGTFTNVNGQPRANICRLKTDGTLDEKFDLGASSWVGGLAVQPDGKVLVTGNFTKLAGLSAACIGRLNADGTRDVDFVASAAPNIWCLAIQPDGKVLVGGQITSLNGVSRSYLGRLNANGSLDTDFSTGVNNTVCCLAVQPDGKILVGGNFTSLAGQVCNRLGQLNADGTLAGAFDSGANNQVNTIAIQADGKIIVGGIFTTLGTQPRARIGRLNADGSVDNSFNPGASSAVGISTLQPDGALIVSGLFGSLGGEARSYLGRLANTDTTTQRLSYDGTTVIWTRSGAGCEFWCTSFEVCTNGLDWVGLGMGAFGPAGWQLSGVSLPVTATVRARGFVAGGAAQSPNWFVDESVNLATLPPTMVLSKTTSDLQTSGFGFDVQGVPGQAVLFEASTNLTNWFLLQTNVIGVTGRHFYDSSWTNYPRRFYRIRVQ